MTSEEISQLIDSDIASNRETLSWFGRPLAECRLTPILLEFTDSFNNDDPIMLWLVFEEDPISKQGYKIVYSEDANEFGLAVQGEKAGVLIGIYGSFVDTLNAM